MAEESQQHPHDPEPIELSTEPEQVSQPDLADEAPAVEAELETAAEPVEGEPEAATEPVEGEPEAATEPVEGEPEAATEPVEGELEAATEPVEGEPVVSPEGTGVDAEPTNPNMDWYILRVNTGYEDQVRKGLEARIEQQELHEVFGRILVPKEEVLQFRAGEKRRTKRKLYPGYVFVEMDRTPTALIMIREVPRVSGFVGAEDRRRDPKPLSKREVRRLLAHVETPVEEPEVVQHFERGEKVKIADGAFANFIGVVDDVREERRKLRVLVTIFGRQTPVEVSYNQVNKSE